MANRMAQQIEAAKEYESFYQEQKRLLQIKKLMKVSQTAMSNVSKSNPRNHQQSSTNHRTEPFGDSQASTSQFKSTRKDLADDYLT